MKPSRNRTRTLALATALVLAGLASNPAMADGTLTGQIAVSLTIGDGCTVSNGSITDGTNEWGTLNFGNYADLTSVVDGTVLGSDGSSAITLTCSSGLSPTLAIDGGLYDDGSLRNLSAGGSDLIAYRLYSDSARSTEVGIDDTISLTADGSAIELPLYGRVFPVDQSSTAPAAATYSDTLVATLSW